MPANTMAIARQPQEPTTAEHCRTITAHSVLHVEAGAWRRHSCAVLITPTSPFSDCPWIKPNPMEVPYAPH